MRQCSVACRFAQGVSFDIFFANPCIFSENMPIFVYTMEVLVENVRAREDVVEICIEIDELLFRRLQDAADQAVTVASLSGLFWQAVDALYEHVQQEGKVPLVPTEWALLHALSQTRWERLEVHLRRQLPFLWPMSMSKEVGYSFPATVVERMDALINDVGLKDYKAVLIHALYLHLIPSD